MKPAEVVAGPSIALLQAEVCRLADLLNWHKERLAECRVRIVGLKVGRARMAARINDLVSEIEQLRRQLPERGLQVVHAEQRAQPQEPAPAASGKS